MKTKIILLFLVFFAFPLFLRATPDILWTHTFNDSGMTAASAVQQTTDGGYIIAGTRALDGGCMGEPYSSSWLIKTDGNGDILWTRDYGGKGFHSIQQTEDEGYIILGRFYLAEFERSVGWLVKVDANGDTMWTKTYNRLHSDGEIQLCLDGGYIVIGTSYSDVAEESDCYLIKTDVNGDTLWTRTYGSTNYDRGFSAHPTTDGGYVIAGITTSNVIETNCWLIKTDAYGDTIWTKTYGRVYCHQKVVIRQAEDGGYIIAGTTESLDSNGYDILLIKTNANGDKLWTKTYGGFDSDYGYNVEQTTDGGYIITGSTGSFGDGDRYWLIKTDTSGDIVWTLVGERRNATGEDVHQTIDGGYIVTGYLRMGILRVVYSCWLMKVGEPTSVRDEMQPLPHEFTLLPNYPNPFNPNTTIRYDLPQDAPVNLVIYDLQGREVWRHSISMQPAGWHQIQWNGRNQFGQLVSTGVYFYRLQAGDFVDVKKMVLMK